MATFFRNEVVKNVGTTPVKVIETNGATRATVIGLSFTNLLISSCMLTLNYKARIVQEDFI